jgi:hypothetical protein
MCSDQRQPGWCLAWMIVASPIRMISCEPTSPITIRSSGELTFLTTYVPVSIGIHLSFQRRTVHRSA